MVSWSGATQQEEPIGWTHITDNTSAAAFADAIETTLLPSAGGTRPFAGLTAPGSALNFAVPLFGTETGGIDNGFESSFQVIDIVGDGAQNDGFSTATARDNALAAGVDVINALPILGEAGLQTWYQNNLVSGTNFNGNPAFLLPASSFSDFETSIVSNLEREISGFKPVPESSSLLGVVTFGALGMGSFLLKKSLFKGKSAN